MNTFTDNENTKYIVEHSFNHFDTKELMYRIKRIFPSGGLDFIVWTHDFLKKFEKSEYNWNRMCEVKEN